MRLFTFRSSPNALKARWALHELAIDFEPVEIDLSIGEQYQDGFQRINRLGQVPVLIHGSLTLRESNAILAYLGRNLGRQLWSRKQEREGEALQWLFFDAAGFGQMCRDVWLAESLAGQPGVNEAQINQTVAKLRKSLSYIEAHLKFAQFFVEGDFTLVDCALGVSLSLLKDTRVEDPNLYPNIFDYVTRVRRRRTWLEVDGDSVCRGAADLALGLRQNPETANEHTS